MQFNCISTMRIKKCGVEFIDRKKHCMYLLHARGVVTTAGGLYFFKGCLRRAITSPLGKQDFVHRTKVVSTKDVQFFLLQEKLPKYTFVDWLILTLYPIG